MKRLIAIILSVSILVSGCAQNDAVTETETSTVIAAAEHLDIENTTEETEATKTTIDDDSEVLDSAADFDDSDEIDEYIQLSDKRLLQYVEDTVYTGLVDQYQSEDYVIENVEAVYISNEYLEELSYNSKSNIFFGYTLSELEEQFEGTPYVFTLGDNGTTVVVPMEDYDDTFEQIIKNVAVGTGVILVCVTVSVVTGGAGAAPVSMIFAAAAKTGTAVALSSGAFSAIFAGAVTGIQTKDFDEALKAAALEGSNGFKWGAITGAVAGGIGEAKVLRDTYYVKDDVWDIARDLENVAEDAEEVIDGTAPAWRQAEQRVLQKYGGIEQQTYLNGELVPFGTKGATRPDVVRTIGDKLEAIECKAYNLKNASNRDTMYREIVREVTSRKTNMPAGTTQRIVLDVTDRGFSKELVEQTVANIRLKLADIYPDIPIDIIGEVL